MPKLAVGGRNGPQRIRRLCDLQLQLAGLADRVCFAEQRHGHFVFGRDRALPRHIQRGLQLFGREPRPALPNFA